MVAIEREMNPLSTTLSRLAATTLLYREKREKKAALLLTRYKHPQIKINVTSSPPASFFQLFQLLLYYVIVLYQLALPLKEPGFEKGMFYHCQNGS